MFDMGHLDVAQYNTRGREGQVLLDTAPQKAIICPCLD